MSNALANMSTADRCIPWYYPPVDPSARMCDPFEARDFGRQMERVGKEACEHCLPDCDETHYSASVSAAPFRKCDFKNLGLTELCDFGGGEVSADPPIWGAEVLAQYKKSASSSGSGQLPDYITKAVTSNMRRYINKNQVRHFLSTAKP